MTKEMQLLACLAKRHSQCSGSSSGSKSLLDCECSCHEKSQFKIESLIASIIIAVGITLTLLF
jgi:hypothetical protein